MQGKQEKNLNSNVYHIAFPAFVDYNIFHYKPLQDRIKVKNNTILFNGIKLRKKKEEINRNENLYEHNFDLRKQISCFEDFCWLVCKFCACL
jgi:hypothetical protein